MRNARLIQRAAIAVAVALACSGSIVHAATATNTFTVTATVANFCTVSAANVAFGSVNAGAAATNTSSSITLTCNKGATVSSVALDNGANAAGAVKQMAFGTERLQYKIDVPTGATFQTCPAAGAGPEWNATNTIVATSLFASSGGAKTVNICASIPSAQYPLAGAYSDTVTVTVTYN